ncbi:MAG: hypothetical protein IT287_08010 [Bdellovibrionaceae bacterium]|nr:hypothetical protein [Pseudobdellovibrionaceae bacterium]
MTITKKNLILSVVILGFGLVSCTKEKEVHTQADNYKPRDIVVEKADSSFTALEKLQSLDFSRQLVINDEGTPLSHQIKNLVLSTTCRGQSSNSSSSHTSNWPNPTTINILDILPTDTLLSRTNEPIYCDISYTTTNTFGSTNTGKASNIQIQSINTFSNLNTNHLFSREQLNWNEIKNQLAVPLPNAASTITCDDISHSEPATTMDMTFEQLIPLDKKLNTNIKSIRQICRAIFRTEDKVVLSPVFTLELPFSKPSIKYSFSVQHEDFNILDSRQKIEYAITNPNTFPMTLQFNLSDKTLHFRTISGAVASPDIGVVKEMALDWHLNGQQLLAENDLQEITIAPGSTSFLVASVVGKYTCGFYKNLANKKNVLLAFNMGLSQELIFHVKETSNENGVLKPELAGANYPSASALPSWIVWHFNVNPAVDISAMLSRIKWTAPQVDVCK